MITQDWKPAKVPKALLIGHDPRLKDSDTIAPYALFVDYYFNDVPKISSEKRKYGLAKSVYDQILYLTNNKIDPKEIYVTNLCNATLPHAPKDKTVYIPEEKAEEGINNIKRILLANPTIEYIFPMSLQVNYWLQSLEFYDSENGFKFESKPKSIGVLNNPPYYEPIKQCTFLMICGNKYKSKDTNHLVIPILHAKCFPLNKNFNSYSPAYERIRTYFL